MAVVQRKLVHKQFNSPIGLYSDNNVKATLNRDLKILSNGTMGVDVDENAQPANLANSAVLKYLQEEERRNQQGSQSGLKRVVWPPEDYVQSRSSVTRQSPGFQPQGGPNYHRNPFSPPVQQHQYQNGTSYPQTQNPSYQQPISQNYQQQQYQQQHQQQQYQQPQSHYQRQTSYHSQYPSTQNFTTPDPTYLRQTTPAYLQPVISSDRSKSPGCTAAFTGGISVANKPPSSAGSFSNPLENFEVQVPPPGRTSNSRGWSHVNKPHPVQSGYVQPQYNQRTQQQYPTQQSYQNQQYNTYQQQASYPPQPRYGQPTNAHNQQQAQQQYQSHDNFYRQPSPGVITLRKEAPITQQSPPVYASQPAAHKFGGGTNMRGDQKWPPQEVKQSDIDNEARKQLARGPVFRPRRVQKDYTPFFNQNSAHPTIRTYRPPPGTQHAASQ